MPRVPNRIFRAVAILMLASACAEETRFGGIETSASVSGGGSRPSLASKEAELSERLLRYHMPYGQVWTAGFKTNNGYHNSGRCNCIEEEATSDHPFCGDVVTDENIKDEVAGYGDEGDGAIFTGFGLAMLAYKAAVTGSSEDLEKVRDMVGTVETLFGVTGKSGVLARAFVPPGANHHLKSGEGVHTNSSGDFEGYTWIGDISRDQYSGIVFGIHIAHEVLDDSDIRKRTKKLLTNFLDRLLDDGNVIKGTDGNTLSFKPTLPDRAMYLLAYFGLGADWTGKEEYEEKVKDLEKRSLFDPISALDVAKIWVSDSTLDDKCHFSGVNDVEIFGWEIYDTEANYYRFNILGPAFFTLAGRSTSDKFDDYEDLLEGFYHGTRNGKQKWPGLAKDKNALFDLYYAARTGDRDAIDSAVTQLERFPGGPRRRTTVPAIDDLKMEDGCDGITAKAVNIDSRPVENFAWQRTPYKTGSSCIQPWVEYPGLDYLLPYWMARYYRFIDETD